MVNERVPPSVLVEIIVIVFPIKAEIQILLKTAITFLRIAFSFLATSIFT